MADPAVRAVTVACLLLVPGVTRAQGSLAAPAALPGPPIRQIGAGARISTEPLGAVSGVRQLGDGRVLVNDGMHRRLLLLDSTLTLVTVVLDSVADAQHSYGAALGGLLPYRGDSSLFIDRGSISMLVLDGAGKVARVRAAPTTTYLSNLTSGNTLPGTDPSGRLVLRIKAKPAAGPSVSATGLSTQIPDTSFIVRMNLDTRLLDTAGVVRIPKSPTMTTKQANGTSLVEAVVDPFPTTDEWAVLSDGTIAYVRGRDYHVEFEDDHNVVTSSPKLPFAWVRLADDERARMVDSIKASQARLNANQYFLDMVSWVNVYKQSYPADFVIPPGVLPPGLPSNFILPAGFSLPSDYERGPFWTPPSEAAVSGSRVPPMPTPATTRQAPFAVLPPEEWPDYKPPFSAGSVRSDGDGNLWIRINLMHPLPGGTIYDVVNRKGELVDRVQVPVGRTLVGFGAGHVAYLTFRDARGLHLERVSTK